MSKGQYCSLEEAREAKYLARLAESRELSEAVSRPYEKLSMPLYSLVSRALS